MNKQELQAKYDKHKQEAIDELELCKLEWKEEFLEPHNFSPDFDFGQEDHANFFYVTLGKMLAIQELIDTL